MSSSGPSVVTDELGQVFSVSPNFYIVTSCTENILDNYEKEKQTSKIDSFIHTCNGIIYGSITVILMLLY